jgi:transcriptional regulator with XRE-family HTH domain
MDLLYQRRYSFCKEILVAMHMLQLRRKKLGITIRALSRLSGVPVATVNRILDDPSSVRFKHVDAVGRVLGVNYRTASRVKIKKVLYDRAFSKAQYIARIVQGTQGLEAAGVDPVGYNRLVEVSAQTLLAGDKRKLWDED